MRLRDVQHVLKENLPRLRVQSTAKPTPSGANGQAIANVSQIRSAVRALSKVPGFHVELAGLPEDPILKIGDGAVVESAAFSNFQGRLEALRQAGGRLLDVLSHALPPQDPLTISVKLPPVQSLPELRVNVDRLVQVLDVCSRQVVGNGVRFSNFDTGSNWIELVAALEVVYWFIVRLLTATQTYRQNEMKLLLAQEHFRAVQITTQHLDGIRLEVEEHLKLQRQGLAENIVTEHGAPKEAIGHVMLAIENLSEMYAHGAEVHRALLNAPKPEVDPNNSDAKPPPMFPDHSALKEALTGPSRQLGPGTPPPADENGGKPSGNTEK